MLVLERTKRKKKNNPRVITLFFFLLIPINPWSIVINTQLNSWIWIFSCNSPPILVSFVSLFYLIDFVYLQPLILHIPHQRNLPWVPIKLLKFFLPFSFHQLLFSWNVVLLHHYGSTWSCVFSFISQLFYMLCILSWKIRWKSGKFEPLCICGSSVYPLITFFFIQWDYEWLEPKGIITTHWIFYD